MKEVKGTYVKKLVSKGETSYYMSHPSYVLLDKNEVGSILGFTYVPEGPLLHHLSFVSDEEYKKIDRVLGDAIPRDKEQ